MTKTIFLMLTYNRLTYTKEALESLLSNREDFHLVVHDNGSSEPGMIDYLKKIRSNDKRIIDLRLSEKNLGLSVPTNEFWKGNKDLYPYLGKIDNDTVVPEDAIERLVDIMDHCPDVAICHGYHWYGENYSTKRLINVNGRVLLRTKWGGGCFYLMRNAIVRKYGYISTNYGKMGGWTRYQIKVRRRGNRIVYAFPLVKVRHLGQAHSSRDEEKGVYEAYNREIINIRKRKD
jgi:GT2 family glycosyltransferase